MAKKSTLGKPQSQRGNRDRKASGKGSDPNDLRFVALHEAGHAVSAVVLGMNLKKVFIKQCPTTGVRVGFTDSRRHTADDLAGKGADAAMPDLIHCFSGPRAERTENPAATSTFAFALDQQDASQIAHLAVCELTHRDKGTIEATQADLRRKDKGTIGATQEELRRREISRARALFSAWLKAGKLLEEHWQSVLVVAELLMLKKKLSGKEVAAIVIAARAITSSHRPLQPAPHSAIPAPCPPA